MIRRTGGVALSGFYHDRRITSQRYGGRWICWLWAAEGNSDLLRPLLPGGIHAGHSEDVIGGDILVLRPEVNRYRVVGGQGRASEPVGNVIAQIVIVDGERLDGGRGAAGFR